MLSWLFEIWFWKLNHKQFKVLSNFWRWNYTKIMHQIIVINFSKFLSNYRFFWYQDAHFFCLLYHFFLFCLLIWFFFFSWFYNTSICIDLDFHNFSSTYFNFITKKQPAQNLKNRVILILEFKNRMKNFKNTMEWMYMNLYGSNIQICCLLYTSPSPRD